MSSRSGSEGEIIESVTEKATTALPSAKHTSVNRKLRDALSPSPVPLSPSPSVTTRSRDRSRSPYRNDRSPRGEKRRRLDDYSRGSTRSDPRHFRVHYEDRPSDGNRRRNGHYGDVDSAASRSYDARDERRSSGRRARQDDRSGRPDRDEKGRSNPRDKSDRSTVGGDDRSRYGSAGFSVSERGIYPSSGAPRSRQDAENDPKISQQHGAVVNGSARDKMCDACRHLPDGEQLTSVSRSNRQGALAANQESEPAPAIVTENLSIEERRKRREAIKAKYKTQTPPLLVQALQSRTASGTPGSPESADGPFDTRLSRSGTLPHHRSLLMANLGTAASPADSSPATPQHDSALGSPPLIAISDDAELANPATVHIVTDEPSAADYDPTMDMEEDRIRHGQRHGGEDVSATAYRERTSGVADSRGKDSIGRELREMGRKPVLHLAAADSRGSAVVKNPVDDMFASDEEDDMFAPPAAAKESGSDAATHKFLANPQGKELDMSLLDNWDDHEGYYRIILGELLDGRYHVQANLGKGMFSSVVRALDNQTNQLVAIKVIRNNESMLKAGTKEMEILEKLADADPEDKKHMIRLERSFTHKGHLCMVFENLSINLREVLKKFGRDVGINLKAVRSYAQQMFMGLSLLRKCNILHADLKPDNILVNEARNLLKICDLGSAGDASENEITPYLVSRFYRAPEIILGIPYDFAIDTWSIGCTLFEMYTGKILFTGRTNNQMLRSIMECRGKFSLKLLKKAEFGAVHFDDIDLNFRSMERDKVTGREVTKLINFVKPTRDLKSRLLAGIGVGSGNKVIAESELKEVNLFADLLEKCLSLNPEKRITPAEALKHPFIHRAVAMKP